MYWTMVNRPITTPDSTQAPVSSLLTVLLSYASPLSPTARSDMEAACMEISDNRLYNYLKFHPDYAPGLTLKSQMVFGTHMLAIPDEIKVSYLPDETQGDRGFKVEMRLIQLVRRIRVEGAVVVTFIARERLWYFALGHNIKEGFRYLAHRPERQPYIYVGLNDTSAETPLDSKLWISRGGTEESLRLQSKNVVPTGYLNGLSWNVQNWVQE
ncbi:hypothetical protein PM082_019652 [Marasmius tenuissimus]|nr:hypothetical protein PM082_019652 [Marasmius tenuissimus]